MTSPAALVERFLARTDRCRPAEVADAVAAEARDSLGAVEAVLYLTTHEESELVPVPARLSPTRPPLSTTDGPAAACLDRGVVIEEDGAVWAPVLADAERLGVLELLLPAGPTPELLDLAGLLAREAGRAVVARRQFSDDVELVRRTQQVAMSAELLWSVLPPFTCSTDTVVVSALLEPSYSSGGDGFDYAVNADLTHLAVLDTMGHGLAAAQVTTGAIAAYRHARRAGQRLVETLRAMDGVVAELADQTRFVTAVLVELDPATGRLAWVSAGHPAPLVVRRGGAVEVLTADPVPPLGVGLGGEAAEVREEYLEPGDVLVLFTDGLTEARDLGGTMLGIDGLAALVGREAASGRSVPEVVRALRRELLADEDAWLSDDATALLVGWSGPPV